MCDSHQPLNGSDSRPYVTREDCQQIPCEWPKAHRHGEMDRYLAQEEAE